ncbi:MAG: LamG-like jellyroll fold domain-containing protein, partial [Sphingobacteriaceae bacterium]
MKNYFILLFLMCVSTVAKAGTYSGGTGTSLDPYKISSKADLLELANTSSDWASYFQQTADIVFDSADFAVGGLYYNSGLGFPSIGNTTTKFTGTYNGDRYDISGLYINDPNLMLAGLFGYTDLATVRNVGLVNCNITARSNVGGLIGYMNRGTVSNCYTTGAVKAISYNTPYGPAAVGGLIGYVSSGGAATITNSYSRASATVQYMESGYYQSAGGLIGVVESGNSTIRYCYATGLVTVNSTPIKGGFIGRYQLDTNTLGVNYYDTETTGLAYPASRISFGSAIILADVSGKMEGKTTAQMKTQSTFFTWDFSTIWVMDAVSGYPIFKPRANPSTLTISSSLTSFSTCTGAASAVQSFTVSGATLTSNVTVTAPTGFEVSLSSGTDFGSSVVITASGSLAATTVYARLVSSATAATKSGNITVASTGATTKTVSVSGTVNAVAQLNIQNSLCANQGLYWSTTWTDVTSTSAKGLIGNVGVTVTHSNGGLFTTSYMYQHASFPGQFNVPNATTLANQNAGTFTFTFDSPVNNPQVAFSSIGNPGTPVGLNTSVPYEVLWNGIGMTYNTNTTMTGAEGFTIVKFPGTHSSITIQYNATEYYANIAFGAENFNCSAPAVCAGESITLTASGGSSYQWSPSTGLSATNTAQVIATPTTTTTYTVIDPSNPCAEPISITINVNPLPSAPSASATQLICPGSTVANLQATVAAGQTVEWYAASTGGSALASTTALVVGNTYYAQAVNANGCASTRTPVVVSTNNALHLDGVNDRVNLSSNSISDGATAFTIEAWIKPDNSNFDGAWHAIFGKQSGANNTRVPSIYIMNGKVHLSAWEDNTLADFGFVTPNAHILQNVWSHLAIVKESTSFKVYVNGVLVHTANAPAAVNVNGPYQIGYVDNYYAGLIDEVRFWNVARNATEISNNYNSALIGSETGLINYYNFNQGIAGGNNTNIATLLDNTSSANNGTLANFALTGSTSNFVSGYFAQITGQNSVIAGNTITLSHPLSGGTWSSASTGIATVNATTGVVTGVSPGTAVITYSQCSQSTSFTVTVISPNTAPTNISLSTASINENNAAAATVGTLSTTDVDAGDTHTYALVAGTGDTDNASFTISGSTLKVNASLNYEVKNSYSIRVRTTDAGNLTYEKAFTITVNNVNEAPSNINLSASSINENNAAAATVGTLSTTDVDAGDTFTYTLVSGTGDTDNASFSISGSTLKANAAFNYEVKNSYSIRVRTTDAGNLTYEKSFTITINNVNEVPTALALSNNSIAENNTVGATLGTLSTTDVDAGDTFTYTIVGGDVAAF